jgi:hypothetical protein
MGHLLLYRKTYKTLYVRTYCNRDTFVVNTGAMKWRGDFPVISLINELNPRQRYVEISKPSRMELVRAEGLT